MSIAIVNQKLRNVIEKLEEKSKPLAESYQWDDFHYNKGQHAFLSEYDGLIGYVLEKYPEVMTYHIHETAEKPVDFQEVFDSSVTNSTLNDTIETKYILVVIARLLLGSYGAKIDVRHMPNWRAWSDGMRAQNS